jgi:hypothetical protein
MVRIIFILLLVSVGLSASYKQALTYYQKGNYKKALIAAKHSKKSYSNPNLHLLWGYSAQVLGLMDEAKHAFERVLILDEDNLKATKALHKINQALEIINADRSAFLLAERGAIPRLKERHDLPLEVKTSVAVGYDSNVNITPGSVVLNDYYGTEESADRIASLFTKMSSRISYKQDIGERGGWYVKAKARAYTQQNVTTEAKHYNLTTGSMEAGAGYTGSTYYLYFPVSYHRVHYLDQDLLEQYRFVPGIMIPIDDKRILEFKARYSQNNYIRKEDKTKDDTTYGVQLGGYYLFDKNIAYLHTRYEQRSAQHNEPSKYIDADYITASVGFNYQFNASFLSAMDYTFRYGQYNDKVGLSNTTRDDNYHQLHVKLSYLYDDDSELYLSETYLENRSNYMVSEYKKHSVMFGITYGY